jgi:hypothetical protein
MPSEDCDLVAGMVAGADSIFNMGSLRHGGMRWLLDDVRALSTLVRFALSRSGAFGSSTASLPGFGSAGQPGPILIGTKQVAFVDIDDTVGHLRLRNLRPRAVYRLRPADQRTRSDHNSANRLVRPGEPILGKAGLPGKPSMAQQNRYH